MDPKNLMKLIKKWKSDLYLNEIKMTIKITDDKIFRGGTSYDPQSGYWQLKFNSEANETVVIHELGHYYFAKLVKNIWISGTSGRAENVDAVNHYYYSLNIP